MKPDKQYKFLMTLIRLTKLNELDWKTLIPKNNELIGGAVILDKIYTTKINGHIFHLYRYKQKKYTAEMDYEWEQKVQLELVDQKGFTEYSFDNTYSMNDLYNIVRERCSNIGKIIDVFLGSDLEIIEATYGTIKKTIDVTEQLRTKIANNKLNIVVSNEIAYDPDRGTPKKLKVRYEYMGETKEKEFDEGQTLEIP